MKLGVRALPPSEFRELPISVRIVLVDVFEHPDSTIGQIVERTGFPQSHVSASVARLRELGMLATSVDPHDRRRTLVGPPPEHRDRLARAEHELEPIDDILTAALVERLGPAGADEVERATAALELLEQLLSSPLPDSPTSRAHGDHSC
jgi:DNA-binding MarR family transcriptional regulator